MGKEIVKDPGCQNSIFFVDMLLNLMKVDEGWSFVQYLCCESLILLCFDIYCWSQTGELKVYIAIEEVKSLHESLFLRSIIILIMFFCILKMFTLYEEFPQKY